MDFENTLMDAPAEMQDNKNELGVLTEASRYDAEACIRLANMYSTGDGVETNLIDAIHWYRYAIRQFGKTEYEKDVMELYLTGIVGAKLREEAIAYFDNMQQR